MLYNITTKTILISQLIILTESYRVNVSIVIAIVNCYLSLSCLAIEIKPADRKYVVYYFVIPK